jgi:hypothetical protein
METKTSSASRLLRINWADGNHSNHEGHLVWSYYPIGKNKWRVLCEIEIATEDGPMFVGFSQVGCVYPANGRRDQAGASNRSARKGEGRVRPKAGKAIK